MLALNGVLLWSGAPRRLAFLHARPAFEASIAATPPTYSGGRPLDRRLGMYHVDELANDPRGGVYFRTHSRRDAFDASRTTFGFSHLPNPLGSPFGDEKYALSQVVGDWYAFRASER